MKIDELETLSWLEEKRYLLLPPPCPVSRTGAEMMRYSFEKAYLLDFIFFSFKKPIV